MPIRPLTGRFVIPAVVSILCSLLAWPLGLFDGGLLIASAQAQSKGPDPLEKARTAVETLINRLRGATCPRES
jgi:HlyD family secretion protein